MFVRILVLMLLQAPARALPPNACGSELEEVDRQVHWDDGKSDHLALYRVNELLDRAIADFRLGRQKRAVATLDDLLEALRGSVGRGLPADKRQKATTAIEKLWSCVSSSRPPAMATLTVRTFELDPERKDGRGAPAGPGVYVKVDGVHVGRTGPDGTLTLTVPSGPLSVEALRPSTALGREPIVLEPGATGTVSIVLDDDKEVAERTDLVLVEAADDVVAATSGTFTMKFVHEGTAVPITKIDQVWTLNRNYNSDAILDHLFTVSGNAIVAKDAAALFAALARVERHGDQVLLQVQAYDERSEFTHVNEIRFRIAPR